MSNYLESYKGKRILVTGGAGAIGSTLVKKLCDLDASLVMVLDNLTSGQRWNLPSAANMMFIDGDILDEIKLKRTFFEKPQIVFHLAAFFANQNSIDHPESDLMVNGMGTLRLLEYSQLSKIERFIYASSGCSIYGSSAPLPLREEFMSLNLSTPYQVTKMLGELYCNFFFNHYDLPVVKTRFFNSYGPGEVPGQYRNVIPNFIYWALQGKPLPITGTGEETRDFTYVEDIVDGLLRAGYYEKAIGQEFNLASGIETKIIDLAYMINEIAQNKSGINFSVRRKWDTKSRLRASIDRAKDIIEYRPTTDFQVGLSNTIQWFRDNWNYIHNSASFEPGMSSAVRNK
ncbi:MAG: nucleotide sugar epimerase [Flavobacterium sp.]|nr:nucleotide sugar epimerase [Flavobacterium sp.]